MSDPSERYKLSPAENERIFRNHILPNIMPPEGARSEQPTAVVLGGQPGAGKTALQTTALAELSQKGPTIAVVGDDLRAYHPAFRALQKADPVTSSQHTNHDANVWFGKLLHEAGRRHVNLVIETTMRQPGNVVALITGLRAGGYEVEARVMAVNERASWQGCNVRFEAMGSAARIPPRDVHDAGVVGVVQSVRELEERKLVSRVVVATREGETVYDNRLRGGEWASAPAAAETIERVRGRPPTEAQLRQHDQRWASVISAMQSRGADPQKIAEIATQAESDKNHFQSLREKAQSQGDKPRGQKPR